MNAQHLLVFCASFVATSVPARFRHARGCHQASTFALRRPRHFLSIRLGSTKRRRTWPFRFFRVRAFVRMHDKTDSRLASSDRFTPTWAICTLNGPNSITTRMTPVLPLKPFKVFSYWPSERCGHLDVLEQRLIRTRWLKAEVVLRTRWEEWLLGQSSTCRYIKRIQTRLKMATFRKPSRKLERFGRATSWTNTSP